MKHCFSLFYRFQDSDDDDDEQINDEHCLGPQKFKESKLDWDEERFAIVIAWTPQLNKIISF